jgi:hypothetical protein
VSSLRAVPSPQVPRCARKMTVGAEVPAPTRCRTDFEIYIKDAKHLCRRQGRAELKTRVAAEIARLTVPRDRRAVQ